MADTPSTRFVTKDNLLAFAQQLKIKYTNQNAYSGIKVDDTTMSAGSATDTFEIAAGSNVTLTAGTKKVTIAATDTTYDPAVAAVSGVGGTAGLLTGADKEKLDGIAAGAEVNQNAYAGIKYGDTTISAASKQDTFEFAAGSNVSITADSANKKLIFAATDTTYSDVVSGSATSGLMTGADKAKLDGIEASADVNVIETVKVAGSALTPDANKAVDITIGTGTSGVGTFKVNDVQYTVYGLGGAAAAGLASNGVADGETGLVTGDEVHDYVAGVVASAYKAAGAIAPAGVASSVLVAANEGKVYNLSADMTLDSTSAALFVDGSSGDVIEGGTNIVVVDDGSGSYKFDKLAGFVDLSPFQIAADLGGLTSDEMTAIYAEL
jgi:hypothetical protein